MTIFLGRLLTAMLKVLGANADIWLAGVTEKEMRAVVVCFSSGESGALFGANED